jgi:AcrR family transcriptional regulator
MADRESRKKEITARRQEQILKAALEIFSRKGFTGATIPDIALSAGVAAGTIYLYFPSKRELFVAVIENLLITPLIKIFEKDSALKFPVTLRVAIEDRLHILQENTLTFLLPLMGEIQRDPELRIYFMEKVFRPLLSRMELLYRSRIASGEFRQMDPAVAVRLVGGMMIGINLLRTMEGPASPFNRLSREQVSEEVMNFILYGLMNEEKSHGSQRDQPQKH